MKAFVHTETHIHIFVTALFIIVSNWKQLKCPPVDKQLSQMVYPSTQWNTNRKKWAIDRLSVLY